MLTKSVVAHAVLSTWMSRVNSQTWRASFGGKIQYCVQAYDAWNLNSMGTKFWRVSKVYVNCVMSIHIFSGLSCASLQYINKNSSHRKQIDRSRVQSIWGCKFCWSYLSYSVARLDTVNCRSHRRRADAMGHREHLPPTLLRCPVPNVLLQIPSNS